MELATYQKNLPDTIEEVAHFLLIAPEKATAMRAEIRAIKKVGLAKEVYDQKLEEQRHLCDMILDASVRLGEMTKAIPQTPRIQNIRADTAVASGIAPKSEAIRDLGFSTKQVERFETLAANKDLVEQEKATAREENRMPTRTNVINMAQARKDRYDRRVSQIEEDAKIAKALTRATHAPMLIASTADEIAAAVWRNADGSVQHDINDLSAAIAMLTEIKTKLMNGGKLYGRI